MSETSFSAFKFKLQILAIACSVPPGTEIAFANLLTRESGHVVAPSKRERWKYLLSRN